MKTLEEMIEWYKRAVSYSDKVSPEIGERNTTVLSLLLELKQRREQKELTHYGKLILCEAQKPCMWAETVLRLERLKRVIKCQSPELCKFNKGTVKVYWEVEE